MTAQARGSRSAGKHAAILLAAEQAFLRQGYLGSNMDEIAVAAKVSKQTVYKHFGSKEALFVEMVTAMTSGATDAVHGDVPEIGGEPELADYLVEYALRQLSIVLTPRLMNLRRLVIGEVSRFPELAQTLYGEGPKRAMAALAALFESLTARGMLAVENSELAASQFNWLVMGAPLNRAMLLGDAGIPNEAELARHARDSVRMFLAAYRSGAPRPS